MARGDRHNPGRSTAFHGGRWVQGPGGQGGITFRFDTDAGQLLEITRRYTVELERQATIQGRMSGPGGVPGTLPGSPQGPSASPIGRQKALEDIKLPQTLSGRVADWLGLPRRHMAIGAEGVRVGHVRLSRSGLGISEKTMVGSAELAGAAVGGQVVGHVMDSVGKALDHARKTREPVSTMAYKAAASSASGLLRGALEIFGFRGMASGWSALAAPRGFFSIDPDVFDQMYNTAWEELFWTDEMRRKKYKLIREKSLMRQRIEEIDLQQRMWSEMLEFSDPASDAARVRNEMALAGSSERNFTRSATGRPLWKVVGYSATEGVQ